MPQDHVSRRSWLTIAAMASGACLVGIGRALADTTKKTKKEVSYQDQPKGKEGLCANCKFFQPPNACLVVEGTISPAGWCQRFEKKSA